MKERTQNRKELKIQEKNKTIIKRKEICKEVTSNLHHPKKQKQILAHNGIENMHHSIVFPLFYNKYTNKICIYSHFWVMQEHLSQNSETESMQLLQKDCPQLSANVFKGALPWKKSRLASVSLNFMLMST